jgi:transposase
MARTGRPKAALELTEDERNELERLGRRARTNRHIALRANLILASASGLANVAVAAKLRCADSTVRRWRKRFLAHRVAGLYDEPRPGAARKISDDAVEEIVVKTLETKPKGRTHWSTRKMAEQAGVSHSTVGRIWRTFGLQPHIVKSFKISDDPLFIEKVRDIVGLYLNPPDNAVVFSFDEKPQIQALERAQPILPMDLGQPERQTHNYLRHGTLDLFAALNIATGKVIAKTKKQHRAKDFVDFLRTLDREVSPDLGVHVILDNLSAHKAPEIQRWLVRHPRFVLHFTPTYSAWLNLVERFFGLLTQEALRRGSHTSIPQLRHAIYEYVDVHNTEGKPFRWTKTADQILESVKRFGQRTVQVHEDAT